MSDILALSTGKTRPVSTRYEATEYIGGGRFAGVYRAYEYINNVDVALKIYHPEQRAIENAKREYEILVKLAGQGTQFFPADSRLITTRIDGKQHSVLAMELAEYTWGELSGSDAVATARRAHPKKIVTLDKILPIWGNPVSDPPLECSDFFMSEHIAGVFN